MPVSHLPSLRYLFVTTVWNSVSPWRTTENFLEILEATTPRPRTIAAVFYSVYTIFHVAQYVELDRRSYIHVNQTDVYPVSDNLFPEFRQYLHDFDCIYCVSTAET